MRVEGDEVDDMRGSKGREEFFERYVKRLCLGASNCLRERGENWVFLVRQRGRVPGSGGGRGEEEETTELGRRGSRRFRFSSDFKCQHD